MSIERGRSVLTAQFFEVVQLSCDAVDVPDAIRIGVKKRCGIDLAAV
jgi:hypothetical protein